MIYSLNGERCTSSSRALVEASIYGIFPARRRTDEEDQVGHPLDPATEIGPLIHPKHVDKFCPMFGSREEGATIIGGGRVSGKGNYVAPTLYSARTTP